MYVPAVELAASAIAAADTTGGGSSAGDLTSFVPYLNFGVIVLLVIMAVTKKGFIPKWVLDDTVRVYEQQLTDLRAVHAREIEIRDAALTASEFREKELKSANEALVTYQRDQLQPALIESTRIVASYVQALSRRRARRRDDDEPLDT